jgi:hypothetical protein
MKLDYGGVEKAYVDVDIRNKSSRPLLKLPANQTLVSRLIGLQ